MFDVYAIDIYIKKLIKTHVCLDFILVNFARSSTLPQNAVTPHLNNYVNCIDLCDLCGMYFAEWSIKESALRHIWSRD